MQYVRSIDLSIFQSIKLSQLERQMHSMQSKFELHFLERTSRIVSLAVQMIGNRFLSKSYLEQREVVCMLSFSLR
jgi:hypothetical protein